VRRLGRLLLTGSADLLLMESAAESLAGRAGYVNLRPFTRAENSERSQDAARVWDLFVSGSLPPPSWAHDLRVVWALRFRAWRGGRSGVPREA
jgi:predicted AAA+ superfamily ATPase